MAEEKRESTRNLLAQLEGGWDVEERDPKPPAVAADAAEISAPSLDELDARWGDDLFGDEDDEDEEEEDVEEEPEEEEPPLPDERLDPVAFAAAKAAREARAAQRKDKRRLKLEAKRAKKKARARANAGKQKKKAKKSRAPTPPPSSRAQTKKSARVAADEEVATEHDESPASAPRPKAVADDLALPKSSPPWRVIAIGAAVVLAIVILVAALVNR